MKRIIPSLLFLFFVSCGKEDLPGFSHIPNIWHGEASFYDDVDLLNNPVAILKIVFFYTDGDSNLGGNREDEEGMYDYDCIVSYYHKIHGEKEFIDMACCNPSYYYFPPIPKGENLVYNPFFISPINNYQGEIVLEVTFTKYLPLVPAGDTLSITVQLLDRDYNMSNIKEIDVVWPE